MTSRVRTTPHCISFNDPQEPDEAMSHRDLDWINVTLNPTAEWIARQITEAFPWGQAPRSLIRDRNRVHGAAATQRIRAVGTQDTPIAPGSPRQNGFVERLIGSIRRECVDHIIALGEAHLRRTLQAYARYYNDMRTHRSFASGSANGRIMSHLLLGGLHDVSFRYTGLANGG